MRKKVNPRFKASSAQRNSDIEHMTSCMGSALGPLCGLLLLLSSGAGTTAPIATAARKDSVFTELFRRTTGWTAGDGALSVPLSDGRVLWLFGDSHIDDLDPATG